MKYLFSLLIIVNLILEPVFAKDLMIQISPSFFQKMANLYMPIKVTSQQYPEVLPIINWQLEIHNIKTAITEDGIYFQSELLLMTDGYSNKIQTDGYFKTQLSSNKRHLLITMSETYIPVDIKSGKFQLNIGALRIDPFIPPIKIPLEQVLPGIDQDKKVYFLPQVVFQKDKMKIFVELFKKSD